MIEAEGRRAERIARSEGELVRPIDVAEGGPLADLEQLAVDFLNRIRDAEMERLSTWTLRPKDLEQSKRGPLGEAEAKLSEALEMIRESEQLRVEQSQMRGGEVVRPIDVPGPLGEFEKSVAELVRSEKDRVKEAEDLDEQFVRPKDASIKGPLGEAELEAVNSLSKLAKEERERLRNIQKVLEDNRPMENDRWSPLGFTEALVVGILRAPQLLMSVAERVQELMDSAVLTEEETSALKSEEGEQESSMYMLKMPASEDDNVFQ